MTSADAPAVEADVAGSGDVSNTAGVPPRRPPPAAAATDLAASKKRRCDPSTATADPCTLQQPASEAHLQQPSQSSALAADPDPTQHPPLQQRLNLSTVAGDAVAQQQPTGHDPSATTHLSSPELQPCKAPGVPLKWKSLGDGAEVLHLSPGLNHKVCWRAYKEIESMDTWRQEDVVMFGKRVLQPRLICYMADDLRRGYKYTGCEMVVQPWHPAVAQLKELAEAAVGIKFDSCLINKYRDGQDNVGWHSDDESLYGKNPIICSVSLGHGRPFVMRRKADHKDKRTFLLAHGDVFVMRGSVQALWQHTVPKRAGVKGCRISLTFRQTNFMKQPR